MMFSASFHFLQVFVITMQLSIRLGHEIVDGNIAGTCRTKQEEAVFEQRLLEKMRPVFVSLVSNMTAYLSSKTNELTRQIEKLDNEIKRYHCPGRDWKVFENACYLFSDTTETWENAKIICGGFGGNSHLVSITSKKINDFLLPNIKSCSGSTKDAYWTGGNDRDAEGLWIWDSNKEGFQYENWRGSQPNNLKGIQDCLEICRKIDGTEYWNDERCSETHTYICEWKILNS